MNTCQKKGGEREKKKTRTRVHLLTFEGLQNPNNSLAEDKESLTDFFRSIRHHPDRVGMGRQGRPIRQTGKIEAQTRRDPADEAIAEEKGTAGSSVGVAHGVEPADDLFTCFKHGLSVDGWGCWTYGLGILG